MKFEVRAMALTVRRNALRSEQIHHKPKRYSMFSLGNMFKNSLVQIDDLYRNIVSKLPTIARSEYCKSLIHRTNEDLSCAKCKKKRRKLKKLLKVARKELKKLSSIF
ncbi:hypothetical protein WIW50_04355 [Flavobacteriaceae bacterium 3-367]